MKLKTGSWGARLLLFIIGSVITQVFVEYLPSLSMKQWFGGVVLVAGNKDYGGVRVR